MTKKHIKYACYLLAGIFVAFGTIQSALNTEWQIIKIDFFFWLSIVTTLLSFGLFAFSLWQYLKVEKEREKSKAQIKIWMEDARGIDAALRNIGINAISSSGMQSKFSSVNDVGLAVYALADTAKALYRSLYEERCITETEYVKQQNEIGAAEHRARLETFLKSKVS
jgi:signal transduction histidine kinase